MPFNSHSDYQTPIRFIRHVKNQDKAVQDSPYGNINVNIFNNNPQTPLRKVTVLQNSKNFHTQTHSKPEPHLLTRKRIADRLFSNAKFVSNSKRQTFLSHSQNRANRISSNNSISKKIRFLRVSKSKNQRPQSPKKQKIDSPQIEVIQEYYMQAENDQSQASKKNLKYISKKKKLEDFYNVDYEEAKFVKKENLFPSTSGQILLKKFVGGKDSPAHKKSDRSITTAENSMVRKNSGKDFCQKLPRVSSFELDSNGVEISKIEAPKYGDTSFFHEIRDDDIKKIEGCFSTFSKLILKDKFEGLKSNELNLSKSFEESDEGDLSLMSRA